MNTIKIKVGSLNLPAAREVEIPQEYAAAYHTVHVEPDTYEVFAYISWSPDGGGMYRLRQLAAACPGKTIQSWSPACPVGGDYIAHIDLPTYGRVGDPLKLLASATIDERAIERSEWDPKIHDDKYNGPRMWRDCYQARAMGGRY